MKHSQNITGLAVALALVGTLLTAPARGQSDTAMIDYTAENPNDTIYSYDWDGASLYYATADSNDDFDGFYEFGSATPLLAANSDFAGASVVTLGNYVYFNTNDINNVDYVYAYNPAAGTTPTLVSTATNFGLYGHNGSLYITGAPGFGTNHIYETGLNSNGTFVTNPPTDLGADSGSSGPLAFDSVGNLFYAPGFGDDSIYKWTAAEVAAALADPTGHPLSVTASNLWYDYSGSVYGSAAGGTSMLIQGNQLLLTLTNFSDPSDLVAFGIAATDGSYDGTSDLLLSSNTALGELREHDGSLYVSEGNSIDQVTAPEPSTWGLLGLAVVVLAVVARRRRRAVAAVTAMTLLAGAVPVMAGPFSPDGDQTNSNGVAASVPTLWATGYEDFLPGPTDIADPNGAKASYGSPTDALGAASATVASPGTGVVSLGDGGSIVLTFAQPIANGPGADLAVFENGFAEAGVPNAYFLELATVAVSSDGVNFFTFPSVSLTQATTQVGSYGTLDPTNLYNLAGSEIAGYGTPFDLSDLIGTPGLNLNDITAVKITDVIGNTNTSLGTGTYTDDDASNPIFGGKYGSTNHVINDPYPTDFTTGGFDLDAVAELNVAPTPEPPAWMMLGSALVLAAGVRQFRRA